MYLLDSPALREHVKGIALVDIAPDSSWHPAYVTMTQANPLRVRGHRGRLHCRADLENLTALVVASAPWNKALRRNRYLETSPTARLA
ncbi:hypothetical protein [Variovorax brevis]|uniref:hypothetical protein n=1 Tax=Variovorax brevis TaxID=3053503 RepID=UPI00403780BD